MSQSTFPNGTTYTSSAQTPEQVATVLQKVSAQILGFDLNAQGAEAYSAVRVSWQPEGQPSWGISDDVCIISATTVNDPFSQVSDEILSGDQSALVADSAFTQVWHLHFTLYGPNCFDHAQLLVSAMRLGWVSDALADSNLYAVPEWNRPLYVPELFQGQWWKRTDVDLQFNEFVSESTGIDAAAGGSILITKENGLTDTVSFSA